jgi:hypothetical protein
VLINVNDGTVRSACQRATMSRAMAGSWATINTV